jgi:tRNA/tmRNA/rRNA uracil-C5-methylase (TrmA/RlmC/RlmD family)
MHQLSQTISQVLYSTIHAAIKTSEQQQARDKSNGTLLLDICCGAGTIGIGLASSVTAVVGVEICEQVSVCNILYEIKIIFVFKTC